MHVSLLIDRNRRSRADSASLVEDPVAPGAAWCGFMRPLQIAGGEMQMTRNANLKRRSYHAREPRIAVQCNAVLIESDGCELDVLLTDVSREGFRLHSRAELDAGSEVILRVAKLAPVRALIRWTRGFEVGGEFLEPMAL
jgi:hypothetical protein